MLRKILAFCLVSCAAISAQQLEPPLPQGSTYYKGMIVSQLGVGIIGCTPTQFIKADGSGCAIPGLVPSGITAGTYGGVNLIPQVTFDVNGIATNAVNIVVPFAPFVDQPPYNAKCDGSTDDTAAIQSAMDANPVIQFPFGSSIQCNVTALVQNNVYLHIIGNQANLYSTISSGSVISFNPSIYQSAVLELDEVEYQLQNSGAGIHFLDLTGDYIFNYNNSFINAGSEYDIINDGDPTNNKWSLISFSNVELGPINLTYGTALHTYNSKFDANSFPSVISNFNTVDTNFWRGPYGGQNSVNFSNISQLFLTGAIGSGSTINIDTIQTLGGYVQTDNNPPTMTNIVSGSLCYSALATRCIDFSPRTLFNGTTATTKAANDNSTNVATTAYVDRAIGTTRTCNGNGCYSIASDGTITAYGTVNLTFSSASVVTGTVTFPNTGGQAFAATPIVTASLTQSPDAASPPNAVTAYLTGKSTGSFTAVVRCSVDIGGSGCNGSLTSTVSYDWIAIGHL